MSVRGPSVLVLLFVCLGAARLISQPQQWGANAAVLRIDARRCAGSNNDRVGTGFLWGNTKQAVTALHVIAGCNSVTIHSQHDALDFKGTVAHVYRHADLALLTLDAEVKATPFVEGTVAPKLHDVLTTWGYGDSPVSMRSFDLRVAGVVSPQLGANVPDDVIQELRKAGSPELDVDILPISDPIAAGLSGAPIFDGAGRVHGIADGGVHHGATHASWAIPVKYLADLARSNDSVGGYVAPNAHLSAAEVTRSSVYNADFVDPTAPSVRCGTTSLRKARVVPFNQVAQTSDNPLGLLQLERVFQQSAPQFNLDVYTDAVSGATVVVPAGARIVQTGDHCEAKAPNGSISVLIQVTTIPAGSNAQLVSLQFEAKAGAPLPALWRPDTAWSNVAPQLRGDGLIVNRKAFAYYFPPNARNFPSRYLFETLAVRGQTFLGVAGFRNNDLAMYACLARLQTANCPAADYFVSWTQLALSVHLATFPVTAGSQTTAWAQ